MSVRNFIGLNGLWTQELHFASVTHSDKLGPEIDSKSSHRMSRGSAVAILHHFHSTTYLCSPLSLTAYHS